MWGAIIGDIVGSVYEFNNIKTKNFELFKPACSFTDDTVMTVAVGKAMLESGGDFEKFAKLVPVEMKKFGRKYPHAGYGGRFSSWLRTDTATPYNSYGNGSAMRASACGLAAKSAEDAIHYAYNSAYCTHNHYDGVMGACATAASVFLAKNGASKEEIKDFFCSRFYKIGFTLDDIRDEYRFEISCQKTVPPALEAFFEADGFEDAIRNAISIGGDSDTLGAITGAVAGAYYGIPAQIIEKAKTCLDDYLIEAVEEFNKKYGR